MDQDEEMRMLRLLREIADKPTPQGCICPPTSEQTCQNPLCPRKDPMRGTGAR